MVVILLVGTKCSGKTALRKLYVDCGFTAVDLTTFLNFPSIRSTESRIRDLFKICKDPESHQKKSPFLKDDITFPETSKGGTSFLGVHRSRNERLRVLERHLFTYYDRNIVITGLSHVPDIIVLSSRPFTFVVGLDASVVTRFNRWVGKNREEGGETCKTPGEALQRFIALDNTVSFGCALCERMLLGSPSCESDPSSAAKGLDDSPLSLTRPEPGTAVYFCLQLADTVLYNRQSIESLKNFITGGSLTSSKILRPDYDTYFMQLSFETAMRSNCLRRSVGAVITYDNKVIATGYNGTPTGCTNCLEGGCPRCYDLDAKRGCQLDSCICVHAEANALLQAGIMRSRNGTIYTTCFPCLGCAKLIVQGGSFVRETNQDIENPVTYRLLQTRNVAIKKYVPDMRKKMASLSLSSSAYLRQRTEA